MQDNTQTNTQNSRGSKWVFMAIGFVAGIMVTLCGLAAIGGLVFLLSNSEIQKTEAVEMDARVTLTVGDDGCGVERSDLMGSTAVSSLTWVIKDSDGYSVLERNAEGEFKYRYFQGGQYSVYVSAWYDGQYHQISNEVAITCTGQ